MKQYLRISIPPWASRNPNDLHLNHPRNFYFRTREEPKRSVASCPRSGLRLPGMEGRRLPPSHSQRPIRLGIAPRDGIQTFLKTFHIRFGNRPDGHKQGFSIIHRLFSIRLTGTWRAVPFVPRRDWSSSSFNPIRRFDKPIQRRGWPYNNLDLPDCAEAAQRENPFLLK